MDINNRNNVTAPGDSDPQVPAAVSGSGVKAGSNVAGSLRSLSSDREGAGVASQAPTTLTSTRADDRENGDAAAKIGRNKTPKPRTIDISTLGEAELLSMIQQCVTGMNAFAANTRNVHKELKETITKTCMLLTQYAHVKNQGPGDTQAAYSSCASSKTQCECWYPNTLAREGKDGGPGVDQMVGSSEEKEAEAESSTYDRSYRKYTTEQGQEEEQRGCQTGEE
ncbi:hypothetical protein QTP88_029722 [Uroleucon formosanum]